MSTHTNLSSRRIAVGRLSLAMYCMHSAMTKPATVRDAERSASPERKRVTLLGLAAAKLVAGLSEQAVATMLMQKEPTLTEDEAEQIVTDAQPAAESMRERRAQGGIGVKREKLYIWKDPQTGWEVTAEPDRVEPCWDDHGEFIQITDQKFPKFVRERHKQIVRLFGLVCYMILVQGGASNIRIKLCVESMRETHVEWFSERTAEELLGQVRETIRKLEAAHAEPSRINPRAVGEHCHSCVMRELCRQGKKFLDRERAAREEQRRVQAAERAADKLRRRKGKDGGRGRKGGRNRTNHSSRAHVAA